MKPPYIVILWREKGARFGTADSTTSYGYRSRAHAERNAAAWMAFDADTVATVIEVQP